MLFTTPLFAWFLAGLLALHAITPRGRPRRVLLLLASYAFYAAWEFPTGAWFLCLLLGSSLLDYHVGRQLYVRPVREVGRRRALLLLSLVANLGSLAVFKYAGFFAQTLNDLLALARGDVRVPVPRLLLPLGISFFTFQTMSYTIDAYRRQGRPYRSLLDFMLFVAFFPQLIAGPIVRASQFRAELAAGRPTGWRATDEGLRIALVGLLLKVVLADNVAVQVDRMYASLHALTPLDGLIACYGFSLQIFCDFAGYSLIAIGLARCFGVQLPRNFALPYLAVGFREFWRRWHITLSTWLRDYLYIPLGGSRLGRRRMLVALGLTMLLGGLWHGASWNFVLWGAAHGLLLVAGRMLTAGAPALVRWATGTRPGRVVGVFVTFHVTTLLWVPFRAPDGAATVQMLRLLGALPGALLAGQAPLHVESTVVLVFLGLFAIYHVVAARELPEERVLRLGPLAAGAYLVAGALLVQAFWVGEMTFIYFAF